MQLQALGFQFENVDYFNCRLHIVWQKGRTIQGDGWESHMATSKLIRPKTYSSIRSVEFPQFVLDEIKVISKVLGHATTNLTEEVYIDNQKEMIDLCNVMNNHAETLISKVQKNDEKIAQQNFDMAKIVDFLT